MHVNHLAQYLAHYRKYTRERHLYVNKNMRKKNEEKDP